MLILFSVSLPFVAWTIPKYWEQGRWSRPCEFVSCAALSPKDGMAKFIVKKKQSYLVYKKLIEPICKPADESSHGDTMVMSCLLFFPTHFHGLSS